MRIVVDGIIYSLQKSGGISRVFSEIMPRMCDLDRDLRIHVLLNKRSKQPLPRHAAIRYQQTYRVQPFLRPRRFWQNRGDRFKDALNRWVLGDSHGSIWHSTYYTLPWRWSGPVVVTVHDMIHERYAEAYFQTDADEKTRRIIREAVLRADRVIAISHATRNDLVEYYDIPGEKVQVIHLGFNPVFSRPPGADPVGSPYLLYVGDRTKYKNFGGLLRAFAAWPKNGEVLLAVAGADWSEEERKQIEAVGLWDRIRHLRYPDDAVLRDLYSYALAFVYPSLYEGFGIPLLEAMSAGCPVLASRIPSTLEIGRDVPVYHEPGNWEDLLASFSALGDETGLAERTVTGREIAGAFSWDITACRTAALYHDLAGRSPDRGIARP